MSTIADDLPPVEVQRIALRRTVLEAPRKWRILYMGQAANGPTDIAPSLRRALEGLGHTVFALDTARHKYAFDNPGDVRGGYGPIFARVGRLRRILDRFRPQIVVLCAGGMVLDAEDAEVLRQRGVLIVGLTLSDPDVQESVLPYVSNLDYHSTNSVLALRRYHEAGLRNTHLLPFGIDRDFVAQRVAPAPDLHAEAICLGHATGRPERQQFMTRLAEQVAVRCYGAGWPFPGSGPVYGERMVQAGREATFHVNFPGTRAGYTNVKCGVFESVGAGAVLCTTEFDEMRRYFSYGEEILAYDSPEDLVASITSMSSDQVEAMRRRAFARLVKEHLYEHRWLHFLDAVEADLTSGDPAVGRERAGVLRRTLAGTHGRPRIIVVSGFYGAGNIGDDLLLESIAGGVQQHVSDAHIVVACTRPQEVERRQGLPAFDRTDPQVADEWAARASSVVLGGGGLWHDYSIRQAGGVSSLFAGARVSPTSLAQLPLLASVHRRGVHVFGMGVGPLEDPEAQAIVRFTAEHADSVVVRDGESRRILQEIPGWDVHVEQAPDPVYAYTLPDAPAPQALAALAGGMLALNLRVWPQGLTDDVIGHVSRAIEEVARDDGLTVVGLPLMAGDAEPTGRALEMLAPDVPRVDLAWSADPEQVVGVLSRCRALVSMRLHANLLAHRIGVPAVGIAYDPKVRLHFEELGLDDMVVALAGVRHSLAETVRRAVSAGGRLPAEVRDRVTRLEADAEAAVATLSARLAVPPVQPPPPAKMHRTVTSHGVVPLPGWDPAHVISPSAGVVSGVNLRTGLPVSVRTGRPAMGTSFAPGAPRMAKDDSVTWSLALPEPLGGAGRRVEIWLRQRHIERRDRRGRLAWQLLLDGRLLHQEDSADWGQRVSVWLTWPSGAREVQIRVVALRDLDRWDWSRLALMHVEAVRVMDWTGDDVRVGVSSPRPARAAAGDVYSTPVATAAATGRRRRLSRARAIPPALRRRLGQAARAIRS